MEVTVMSTLFRTPPTVREATGTYSTRTRNAHPFIHRTERRRAVVPQERATRTCLSTAREAPYRPRRRQITAPLSSGSRAVRFLIGSAFGSGHRSWKSSVSGVAVNTEE